MSIGAELGQYFCVNAQLKNPQIQWGLKDCYRDDWLYCSRLLNLTIKAQLRHSWT